MDTATIAESELTEIAVSRIISQAERLSGDKSLDVWKEIYEPAKRAIAEFGLAPAEYQQAIAELTEALKI